MKSVQPFWKALAFDHIWTWAWPPRWPWGRWTMAPSLILLVTYQTTSVPILVLLSKSAQFGQKWQLICSTINCLIVVSPYTLSSDWIVITNARVFHNNKILPYLYKSNRSISHFHVLIIFLVKIYVYFRFWWWRWASKVYNIIIFNN